MVGKVVPILVGVGLMLSMISVSLGLFLNALSRYYSPHQGRIVIETITNAFHTSLLALEDIFRMWGSLS